VQKVQGIDDTSFFPSSLKPSTFLDIDKIFKTTYTGRDYIGKTLIHQRFLGFYINYEELKPAGSLNMCG
jgi:hypothetical protein